MSHKPLLLFASLLIIFQSCRKLEPINKEDLPTTEFMALQVENGMLKFNSHTEFLKSMESWNIMDPAEVTRQLASMDYISYHSDTTLDKEFEVHPDILLQKVINNKGAVMVNDTIFVLTPGAEILIKNADLETYKKVIEGNFVSDMIEKVATTHKIYTSSVEIAPLHTVPYT